jgi:hypothetical protein
MFSLNLIYFSYLASIIYDLYFYNQLELLYYNKKNENVERIVLFFSITKHNLFFTKHFKINNI